MKDGKEAQAPKSSATSRPRPLSPTLRRCENAPIAFASGGGTHYLIFGVTHRLGTFRPSDWPERLAGVVALFVDERGAQAQLGRRQFASPVVHDGIKSLLIDAALRDACPAAFVFVSNFAADNELPMYDYV